MTNRAAEIFERIVERPASERAALLDTECAGDGGLRSRVERLVRAHESAGAFLAAPTGPGFPPGQAVPGEGPGTQVGRYRLLELIGEGGFGRVFMAEQREPVLRRVAVKVIKAGMDTAQVVARFEAERQALALMDHPGIATVLDGGATVSGRPYFVMELVKGVSITSYCDSTKLPVPDRLALFMEVCGAVQHAHQKGVIHRDLKPGNIIVAERDGRARPKIIDFGIAKATSGRLTDRTLFTEFRQFVGTPEYMSPEQTMGAGIDVDTRTDIYSLGVILYELLTGTTPLDPGSLRSADLAEMQRLIRETDTPRPSTRLSALKSIADVAAHRRTEPGRLGPLIRGDLDWIVLKAIEKDRNRRYETAAALAEDVRRFLSHEPVSATPPSTAYRLRKFVRKHRIGVLAACLVAGAMAAGLVGTTAGLVWARRERDEAVRQLARATEISRFTTSILGGLHPHVARSMDTALLRKVLSDAAARIDQGEIKDPLIEAELRQTIAIAYRAAGDNDSALAMCRAVVDLRRTHSGPENPETLAAMDNLASVLSEVSRHDEARAITEEILAIRRRILPEDDLETAGTCNFLGMIDVAQGRFAQGAERLGEAARVFERTLGPDDRRTTTAYGRLGEALRLAGMPREAEPIVRRTVETRRRLLGPEHRETLGAQRVLGQVLIDLGRPVEGEAVLRGVIDALERAGAGDSADAMTTRNDLAFALREQQRFQEAESLLRDALESMRRARGPDHLDTLLPMGNLAVFLHEQGVLAEAESLLRVALEGRQRLMPPDHPHLLVTMGQLARILKDAGQLAEAEALARAQVQRTAASVGPAHARTLAARHTLAQVLRAAGELDEAETEFRSVLEQRRVLLGPAHRQTVHAQLALAGVLAADGRPDEAAALIRDAEGIAGDVPPGSARDDRVLARSFVDAYEALLAADPAGEHDAGPWRALLAESGPGGG